MSLRTLIGLILCNVVWSANPLMGKWALRDFNPVQAAWLRYASAFLAYWIGYLLLIRRKEPFLFPRSFKDWGLLTVLGLMSFFLSPLLQLIGLSVSFATENSLIIAMEPLITVFLAWLFLRERISLGQIGAISIALIGFIMLTGFSFNAVPVAVENQTFELSHWLGNWIILTSLVGEACYSILGRKLILRNSPWVIFGLSLTVGVVLLTLFSIGFHGTGFFLADFGKHLTWRSGLAFIWMGPLATAGGYVFWMLALRSAPVSSIAVTLFIQPFAGAFFGYVFMHERLSWVQVLGGSLIGVAVLYQTRLEIQGFPRNAAIREVD